MVMGVSHNKRKKRNEFFFKTKHIKKELISFISFSLSNYPQSNSPIIIYTFHLEFKNASQYSPQKNLDLIIIIILYIIFRQKVIDFSKVGIVIFLLPSKSDNKSC